MTEITEIDFDKYYVIKKEDIEKYIVPKGFGEYVNNLLGIIALSRKRDGKPMFNKYLVLNVDDDIDISELIDNIPELDIIEVAHCPDKLKVSDIAIPLVNAIIRAKKG